MDGWMDGWMDRVNLLVLIHFGNMKRSGFQSKAIPKVWVSFYYLIMFTCCVETK